MSRPPATPLVEGYEALRHDRTGRVVPRDVLRVHGPDAESYLQGQCTQDVSALGPGESAESLVLSPQGKVEGYLRVTRTATDAFVLDTAGGFGPALHARLQRFKLRVKAEIEDLAWSCVSVRGPASPTAADVRDDAPLALEFQWGTRRGVDILGPDVHLPDGVRSCAPEAWEAWRIELGIPDLGAELDDRTIPAEAGLLERCVSFTKGCYTGQELVARLDSRGNRVARHLRAVVFGGDLSAPSETGSGAAALIGAEILDPGTGKVVGSITSSAWSPAWGVVSLGYVHRDVTPPADVVARVGDGERAAVVRSLPLDP